MHLSASGAAALAEEPTFELGGKRRFCENLGTAQAAIGTPGFGQDVQSMQSFGGLQEGLLRRG